MAEIVESDFSKNFNPLKNYFNTLPKWKKNQKSEIDKLCQTLKTTNEDFKIWTLPRFLIAVVASIMEDDKFNHQTTVLVGKQGIGKSTWIRQLMPKQLLKYFYSGTINPNNKDTLIFMSRCMLIDLDELHNLNRSQNAQLKELITKAKITFRVPYGRYTEDMPRRASFIGSINDPEFLYDHETRRFLCYSVKEINLKSDIDIDKVWGEAFYRYNQGEQYWFDLSEQPRIESNNEMFKVQSIYTQRIEELFFKPKDSHPEFKYLILPSQLYYFIFLRECQHDSGLVKLGREMKRLGFQKVRKMIDGKRLNYYEVVLNQSVFKEHGNVLFQDTFFDFVTKQGGTKFYTKYDEFLKT